MSLVDTNSGPLDLNPNVPDWVNQQLIEEAGGFAAPAVVVTPAAAEPPPTVTAGSPPDQPPTSGPPPAGTYVTTVTGPVWVDPNLPAWVNQLNIDNAGGLPPAPGQIPQPPAAQVGPRPVGLPGATPPREAVPPATTIGAQRIEGVFTTPPEGLKLAADWEALSAALVAGGATDPSREAIPPSQAESIADEFLQTVEGLGLAQSPPWDALTTMLRHILRIGSHGDNTTNIPMTLASIAAAAALPGSDVVLSLAANAGIDKKIANVVAEDAGKLFTELQSKYENAFRDAHGLLIDALDVGAPDDLNAAEARAGRAVEIALGAGVTAHGIAVALELLHPLKSMGFGQIAGLVAEAAGFAPITSALWSALLGASIRRPLDSLYNTRFPTAELGIMDVLQLARRHEYDYSSPEGALGMPTAFADALARHGLNVDKAETLWAHNAQVPRLYDVVRMADTLLETGPPPPELTPLLVRVGTDPTDPLWWLDYQLRENGFASWTIPTYKRALVHRASTSDITKRTNELDAQLRDGYIDEGTFRDQASSLGIREETTDLNVVTAKLTRGRTYWDGLTTQWESAYLNQQITLDELHSNLAIFTHDEVELDFKLAVAQMKHDIKTKATAQHASDSAVGVVHRQLITAYRTQYRNALIDGATMLSDIVALGFTVEYATAVLYSENVAIDVAKAKTDDSALKTEQARVTELLAQSYETQFADGKLTAPDLATALTAVGMSAPLVRARVARATARQLAALNKVAQQQHAAIERKTTEEEQRQARAAVAATDHELSQRRAAFLAEQIALHTAKDITTDQLYQALLDAGWDQPLAAELAAREAARRKEGQWTPGQPVIADGVPAPMA